MLVAAILWLTVDPREYVETGDAARQCVPTGKPIRDNGLARLLVVSKRCRSQDIKRTACSWNVRWRRRLFAGRQPR